MGGVAVCVVGGVGGWEGGCCPRQKSEVGIFPFGFIIIPFWLHHAN